MLTADERYEQVVARGLRMRRRRQGLLGSGAVGALVVVALAAAALAGDDGGDREAVVADDAGSTTTVASSTTEPGAVSGKPTDAVPSTTSTSTTLTEPAPTDPDHGADEPPPTSTPPVCRNSRDPACGSFYWDPVPANEPVTFTITFSPARPVAGQPVTLTVEAHDPEAEVLIVGTGSNIGCFPHWGDGGVYAPGCGRTAEARVETPPRTGPWDPPPPVGASATATFEHTYTSPGTYTVTVYAAPLTSESVRNTDYDVYGGQDSDTVTITVG